MSNGRVCDRHGERLTWEDFSEGKLLLKTEVMAKHASGETSAEEKHLFSPLALFLQCVCVCVCVWCGVCVCVCEWVYLIRCFLPRSCPLRGGPPHVKLAAD